MKKRILVVLFALALSANLHAQVTIGDLTAPAKGALLDLNKTVKGGLTLSNVKLANLYTIPATFPGMSSPPADAKAKFTGAMVYHTGGNNIAAGIYVWNGTNWAPVEENCLPADWLTVTLTSSTIIAKTGDPVTFSVSTGVGARCAEGETYEWYRAAAANAYGASSSYTTVYPESNKSITFSPANAYKVKVEASNIYSASAKATSNEVTVYVTNGSAVPSSLYDNNYDVSGAPCYDVDRSAARTDSFATGYGKTYSFVYGGAYSDLQVSYEDPHGLVDHIIQPVNKSNPTPSGKEPFTVVFKPVVKTSVPALGRDTVKLWVSYKVGTNAKLALRNIRLQDAACHCPARIDRLSDRWLTFACHNLGGLDITSDSQTLTQAHHGDWYRFGAAVASLTNVAANDGYSNTSEWSKKPVFITSDVAWPNTSIDANGVGNPCPAGWRLPTNPEFAAAINKTASNGELGTVNNELAYPGTWGGSNTNFSAYIKVGDYLYLPAAGIRHFSNGSLNNYPRGSHGYYWSRSAQSSSGWHAYFSNRSSNVGSSDRANGFSVRCVAVE
jgi:uncharacterized protein (TIGR02145 family)